MKTLSDLCHFRNFNLYLIRFNYEKLLVAEFDTKAKKNPNLIFTLSRQK